MFLASKTAQDLPKIAPRWAKTPPSEPPGGSRRPQDSPRGAQAGPTAPQEGPKRGPRGGTRTDSSSPPPQDDPRYCHQASPTTTKRIPEAPVAPQQMPQTDPTRLSGGPKRFQNCVREAPQRLPERPHQASERLLTHNPGTVADGPAATRSGTRGEPSFVFKFLSDFGALQNHPTTTTTTIATTATATTARPLKRITKRQNPSHFYRSTYMFGISFADTAFVAT